jgi:RimJ/RimL family protein N-acetyltransferase
VTLLPLDTPERIALAAHWLAQKENYQWLDFGNGGQSISPLLLKVMAQRDAHFLRLYTSPLDDRPIGIAALNHVDRRLRSAVFWGAAGDKSFRSRGWGALAGSKFLTLAFRELGLHSINTWVAETNPSLRLVERLGFRFIGRQRQCHIIDGRAHDRLLFDLLASEHREIEEDRWERVEERRIRREAQGRAAGRTGHSNAAA